MSRHIPVAKTATQATQASPPPPPPRPTCSLCCENLTVKNAVNPLCGHTSCSTCFWKWAKTSDACPFCRGPLIPRDRRKELEMRNLLDRCGEIRTRLEELYNESDAAEEMLYMLQQDIEHKQRRWNKLQRRIQKNRKILRKIKQWKPRIQMWEYCPEKAIELWKIEAKEIEKKYRIQKIKELRCCLDELEIIIEMKFPKKYGKPCFKALCNRTPNLIRATARALKNSPQSPPISDFHLNELFGTDTEQSTEGTDDRASSDQTASTFPAATAAALAAATPAELSALAQILEELRNNPIEISLSSSSALDAPPRNLSPATAHFLSPSRGAFYTFTHQQSHTRRRPSPSWPWSIPDIFEGARAEFFPLDNYYIDNRISNDIIPIHNE